MLSQQRSIIAPMNGDTISMLLKSAPSSIPAKPDSVKRPERLPPLQRLEKSTFKLNPGELLSTSNKKVLRIFKNRSSN